MSNHLGQIYSTTKNAEKYIVLNSQNVELSGNVKLTNGNLEVSNNLIFNNFSVSDKINFRENSGSTSYNIVNNSLTSNNDASLNNVQINGTLNLPDSSNNGYGVSGEVLISRAANSTPIWGYPAQHHAYFSLTSDFTVTDGGQTDLTSANNSFTEIKKLSDDVTNNNDGTFTINTLGTYHIIYRLQMLSRASGSSFARAVLRLKPNGSSTISYISESFSQESSSSYEILAPFMINYLNEFDAGDVIYLSAINNNTYAISGQNGTNVRTSVSFVRIA